MIDPHEDQAAGLRRLFRRAPPVVVALYAAGRNPGQIALQAAHRVAGHRERVLMLDEVRGERSLAHLVGEQPGGDLLSVLGAGVQPRDLVQPLPGLLGRVPVAAAALALPLLDSERREVLLQALRALMRPASFILVHSDCEAAEDPSPFIFAAPRRLVLAEASHRGATEAYQVIKRLAAAGAGSIHVAVTGARGRADAKAFFTSLDGLVARHVGLPLAWLGEVERDDLAGGLSAEFTEASPRDAEAAFLRRLASCGLRRPRAAALGSRT
ncbi:MAG TPA: flagellar FleN [Aromatoleum sp.]|uniref:MinD/ParA family ATP-binding protein n=1 Tax=Aromatoleum sp. TaxID=2307007 RepID=UPI002B47BBC9|nr:flagellar FleN [Aromatoleum sp.]HJV25274.1 flagellar FleN [Aromatoleum sp.]